MQLSLHNVTCVDVETKTANGTKWYEMNIKMVNPFTDEEDHFTVTMFHNPLKAVIFHMDDESKEDLTE